MYLEFVFGFLAGIGILAFVGNSFFSWITLRKPVKTSMLETFMLSFGIGVTFIVLYGYCVDLVVSSVGLISHTQFFVLVGIPICISIVLKLSSIKVRIGKQVSLWAHLRSQIKLSKETIDKAWINFKTQMHEGKYGRHVVLLIGITIFVIVPFFVRIGASIYESPAQFSSDPYSWVYHIIQYADKLTIDYSSYGSYPEAFMIFEGFFLAFFYNAPFSILYYFLKWFPVLNLCLFVLLLYILCKRVSKNPFFFIVAFLLTFNRYFYYRFTILLPSPLTIILLELLLLQMLIPTLPRFLEYLTLGTILVIHPLNGVIICGFFSIYKVVEGLIKICRYFKNWRHPQLTVIPPRANIRNLGKKFLGNAIAFFLPIAIFSLCLTIRYSPNWLQFYLYIIKEGITPVNSVFPIPIIGSSGFSIEALFVNGIPDYSLFWARINWITRWGCEFFWFTLICLFIPQRYYIDVKGHHKFVLFLRVSLFLAFFIFLLPGIGFLLDFAELIPGGFYLANFVNSSFFSWASVRIFEVSNLISALFLAMVLEGGIRRIFRKIKQIRPNAAPKIKLYKVLCVSLVTSSLFTWTIVTFVPYYEYSGDYRYIDAFLSFRDYLDQEDPGAKEIMFTREDGEMYTPLFCIMTPERNFTQICCNINLEFISSNFTTNLANTVDYLIISFHNVDETIAADIRDAYVGSSYQLFYNDLILILKFE